MQRNLGYAGGALVLSVSFLAVALDTRWAFVAAGVLLLIAAWYAAPDSWRARMLPAKWLPPAPREAIQRVVEAKEWGRARYKFTWQYSEDEGAILLHGKPRDKDAGTWCDVRGPDGMEDHSGTFRGEFWVRYPQQFPGAKARHAAAPAGRYRVRWGAIVGVGGTAVKRRLATSRFKIHSSSKRAISSGDLT